MIARLLPFLFLGVMIVLFVAGIIVFSYLLIFGALVGLVLFSIVWLRDTLFSRKKIIKRSSGFPSGRVINHDKDD